MRLVLAIGFAAVPLRAVLLSFVTSPLPFVAVQALDGLGAAAFGTLVPLVAADLTRGQNNFNMCLGLMGVATGLGATLSTALGAAWLSDTDRAWPSCRSPSAEAGPWWRHT